MKIGISNYRGCASLEGEAAPVLLIAGPNGAGKSSAIEAIRAALVGKPTLHPGSTKKNADRLVKRGASRGLVRITGPDGETSIDWPGCEFSISGEAPKASAIAAGVESIADAAPKDRPAMLAAYIGATPAKADLVKALKDVGAEDLVETNWALLSDGEWDAQWKRTQEAATKIKGKWEAATGESWGEKKAATWEPAGWTAELGKLDVEALELALVEARSARDRVVTAGGAGQAEIETLGATVRAGKDLSTQGLAEHIREIERVLAESREYRATLPAADEKREITCDCPACGVELQVEMPHDRGSPPILRENKSAKPLTDAEIKKRRMAIASADGTVGRLVGEIGAARTDMARVQAAIDAAKSAEEGLGQIEATEDSTEALAAADRAVSLASAQYDTARAKTAADAAFASWRRAAAVASVLSPDGVRRTVMLRQIEGFNADLEKAALLAGWPAPRVSDDLTVRMGDDLYEDHSRSRQWRIRLLLQVACAWRDGSAMIAVDELDLLDVPSRPGALKLLLGAKLPAVVAMTTTREKALDLGAKGLGQTVIIENGEGATP